MNFDKTAKIIQWGKTSHQPLRPESQQCLCATFFKILTNWTQYSFPGGSDGKVSAYNAGDPGSIPGSGRSSGEGNGNPLQYSCLENPTGRGAWWATVYGVAKSRTRLSDFTFTFTFFSFDFSDFIMSWVHCLFSTWPWYMFCSLPNVYTSLLLCLKGNLIEVIAINATIKINGEYCFPQEATTS